MCLNIVLVFLITIGCRGIGQKVCSFSLRPDRVIAKGHPVRTAKRSPCGEDEYSTPAPPPSRREATQMKSGSTACPGPVDGKVKSNNVVAGRECIDGDCFVAARFHRGRFSQRRRWAKRHQDFSGQAQVGQSTTGSDY
jgi:hypothetical protein